MFMFSPLDMEARLATRRDDLLREAAAERLAQAAGGPSGPGPRTRLAAVLHRLADYLDTGDLSRPATPAHSTLARRLPHAAVVAATWPTDRLGR